MEKGELALEGLMESRDEQGLGMYTCFVSLTSCQDDSLCLSMEKGEVALSAVLPTKNLPTAAQAPQKPRRKGLK